VKICLYMLQYVASVPPLINDTTRFGLLTKEPSSGIDQKLLILDKGSLNCCIVHRILLYRLCSKWNFYCILKCNTS
jgi:hypothetical protein